MTTNNCTRCNGRGFIWWAGFVSIPATERYFMDDGQSKQWVQVKRPCNHCQEGEPSEQKPIARSISYHVKKDTDNDRR